jgi:hypothetical protein
MKRMSLALILVLTAYLFTPAPALSGQWMMIHGMGGQFWGGYPDAKATPTISGLMINFLFIPSSPADQPKRGYAEFAVPSLSGGSWAARYLKVIVNFMPFNNNLDINHCAPAWVTQIIVVNGNEQVKIFNGQWGGGSYQEISLDLGSAVTFSKGLGIQLQVEGIGPKPADAVGASIFIVGVGAEFSQTASSLPATNLLLND